VDGADRFDGGNMRAGPIVAPDVGVEATLGNAFAARSARG
jgi:hypothetical protein